VVIGDHLIVRDSTAGCILRVAGEAIPFDNACSESILRRSGTLSDVRMLAILVLDKAHVISGFVPGFPRFLMLRRLHSARVLLIIAIRVKVGTVRCFTTSVTL